MNKNENLKTVEEEKKLLENGKPYELTNDQIRDIQKRLDTAQNEGLVCPRDFLKIYQRLGDLSPEEKKDALKHLEEYLKTKKGHQEDYEEKLKKAVEEGSVTEEEKKDRLKAYEEMTGEERKEEDEHGLEKWLKEQEGEKKEYDELLQESPHFSQKGTVSEYAVELQEKFSAMDEKEKRREQRRLLKLIKTLDLNDQIIDRNEDMAGQQYRDGNFDISGRLMKRNMRILQRYPMSLHFQEHLEKTERYIGNLNYEQTKYKRVEESEEDISDCAKSLDHEKAIQASQKAVSLIQQWIQTTFNGTQEIPRPEKYVTPFMLGLQKRFQQQQADLEQAYRILQKEEEAEEEQHGKDHKTVQKELAKDEVTQVHVKAASDMAEHLDDAAAVDQAEESEQEGSFHPDTMAHQLPEDEKSIYGRTKRIVQHDEADDLTEEELQNTVVQLAEHEDGELHETEAKEILDTDTTLELTAEDREISTKKHIERELNKKMAHREITLLKRLKNQGRITEETYGEEYHRALHEAQAPVEGERAKDILDEQWRTGELVEAGDKERSARELEEVLHDHHEEEHEGGDQGQEERSKKAEQRKKEMLEQIVK